MVIGPPTLKQLFPRDGCQRQPTHQWIDRGGNKDDGSALLTFIYGGLHLEATGADTVVPERRPTTLCDTTKRCPTRQSDLMLFRVQTRRGRGRPLRNRTNLVTGKQFSALPDFSSGSDHSQPYAKISIIPPIQPSQHPELHVIEPLRGAACSRTFVLDSLWNMSSRVIACCMVASLARYAIPVDSLVPWEDTQAVCG